MWRSGESSQRCTKWDMWRKRVRYTKYQITTLGRERLRIRVLVKTRIVVPYMVKEALCISHNTSVNLVVQPQKQCPRFHCLENRWITRLVRPATGIPNFLIQIWRFPNQNLRLYLIHTIQSSRWNCEENFPQQQGAWPGFKNPLATVRVVLNWAPRNFW